MNQTVNAWEDTVLTGLYTLSPLHIGSGQASGAVDQPIARDAVTQFPIIPATALKGTAREALELSLGKSEARIIHWFGSEIEFAIATTDDDKSAENAKPPERTMKAGQLCFSEARLIAYPARSLNQPFLHITCPLILERLQRDLRLFNIPHAVLSKAVPTVGDQSAKVCHNTMHQKTLVIEDLVIHGDRVVEDSALTEIAQALASLITPEESDSRKRLETGLVLLSDSDFSEIIERIVPVRARIKLTDGKTTDTWTGINPETGKEEQQSGNLWYEEFIPSDTLFASFIGGRFGRTTQNHSGNNNGVSDSTSSKSNAKTNIMADFTEHKSPLSAVQLGGNETVGHGLCYWHFPA